MDSASDLTASAELLGNGLVSYASGGGVAWITLVNPPANGYSHAMMRDLDEAILRARFDERVQVLVLAGAGEKFFCAGADIGALSGLTPQAKYYFCLHANETINRLEQTPKLVIAALHGHCVGGGLEVALAADIRLACRDSGKVGLPEVNLGVLPGTGGTQRLARLVGKARALEMMALGRTMAYDDAAAIGLVNHVLEPERYWDEVNTYAQQFVPPARASHAVGLIKRAVQTGLEMSFEQGLSYERELQQQLFTSADAREGLAAYTGKRPPQFEGR
jgi:enoyl-CoA hydratase/carnithine racemase